MRAHACAHTIFFFLRQRESASVGEGQRKREDLKQAPHSALGMEPDIGLDLKTWRS